MVEQIVCAADQEAQRPVGQRLRRNHVAHHLVREQRGGRGRLGEHRHAGEQRHRRLLPQAPAREVERVDVHGDAAPRHHQMDRLIVLRLGQPHRLLVEQHLCFAEPGAEPRVVFQRADAAVDVDRGVDLGVAGIRDRDAFILGAVGGEHIGDGAEQFRPLGVVQCGERGVAVPAREGEPTFEIDPLGGRGGDHLAAHRIDQRGFDTLPARPASRHVAVKRLRIHGISPGFADRVRRAIWKHGHVLFKRWRREVARW